jgi:putative intracellular protease/amidase
MVLTSCDRLGDAGPMTGFWLEEFAAAYYLLADAGAEITVASPGGGHPPIDPRSGRAETETDAMRRLKGDAVARTAMADTIMLAQVALEEFDAVLYLGGHGALCDLAEDKASRDIAAAALAAGRPLALVGHGVAALRHAVDAAGNPLVRGRRMTGPRRSEEAAAGLAEILPVVLEDELARLGARYASGPDGTSYAVRDGRLITGQNTASAAEAARKLLDLLKNPG